jgi:hypothetical protein
MGEFQTYAGMLNAVAMALLLVIIAGFYLSLTMEAFRGVSDSRASTGALRRGGAGADFRAGEDEVRPVARRVRRKRALSAA